MYKTFFFNLRSKITAWKQPDRGSLLLMQYENFMGKNEKYLSFTKAVHKIISIRLHLHFFKQN